MSFGGSEFDFASSDYIVIPGVIVSLSLLVIVSLLTPPSPREKWEPFFTKDAD
jgi:SSS family solute:Na+ symporter/sodium/proline symporter